MRHAAAYLVDRTSAVTKEHIVQALDEAGLLLSHIEHTFNEQIKLGHVQVCFETDANMRKIDLLLS